MPSNAVFQAGPEDAVYTVSNGRAHAEPCDAQGVPSSDGFGHLLALQDFHHLDVLSHFDAERIPERVVHANGAGAHG